jgi:hypothetical protein
MGSVPCILLQEQYKELFAVTARGNTPAQSLFLLMNQHAALSVANFVQQLHNFMDALPRVPTDNVTTQGYF